MREWYAENRDKMKAATLRYFAKHPGKRKAFWHAWFEKNKGSRAAWLRARNAGLSWQIGITQTEWEAIVANQRGQCNGCGKKTKLTMDHVDPISEGGVHAAYNMQGLCLSCNSRKRNRIEPGTQIGLPLGKAAG